MFLSVINEKLALRQRALCKYDATYRSAFALQLSALQNTKASPQVQKKGLINFIVSQVRAVQGIGPLNKTKVCEIAVKINS